MCQDFYKRSDRNVSSLCKFWKHTYIFLKTNKQKPQYQTKKYHTKKILFRVSFCLTLQRVKTTCFMAAYSLIPRQNKPPEYYCNCASSVVLESYSKTFHSAVSFFLSKLNVVLFIQAHIFHSSVPSQQSNIQYSLPLLSTDAF